MGWKMTTNNVNNANKLALFTNHQAEKKTHTVGSRLTEQRNARAGCLVVGVAKWGGQVHRNVSILGAFQANQLMPKRPVCLNQLKL
jgi:hypothetical protein